MRCIRMKFSIEGRFISILFVFVILFASFDKDKVSSKNVQKIHCTRCTRRKFAFVFSIDCNRNDDNHLRYQFHDFDFHIEKNME